MTDTPAIDNVIPRADIVKRAARIGAEIRNIKLSGDLSDQVIGAINKVLLEHKVIFFRDQHNLDDDGQRAFAAKLGTPTTAHPTLSHGESVLPIDSRYDKANSWHTDVTFVDRIPAISILRAVTLPAYGGATTWANTVAAYAKLPVALQALVDKLYLKARVDLSQVDNFPLQAPIRFRFPRRSHQ